MHKNKKDVDRRLACIAGQIAGIRKMIENDSQCEDIIIQLSAVIAASRKVGKIIFNTHLSHCVKKSIEEGKTDALEKIMDVVDKI